MFPFRSTLVPLKQSGSCTHLGVLDVRLPVQEVGLEARDEVGESLLLADFAAAHIRVLVDAVQPLDLPVTRCI